MKSHLAYCNFVFNKPPVLYMHIAIAIGNMHEMSPFVYIKMCMKCDPGYFVHFIGFPDTGNVNAYMLCHPIMQLKVTYADCIIIGSSLSLACMNAYTLYAY